MDEEDSRGVLPVLPPDEVLIEVFIEILCKSEFNTCVLRNSYVACNASNIMLCHEISTLVWENYS